MPLASRDERDDLTTILRIDFGVLRVEKWDQTKCVERRTYTPSDLLDAGVHDVLFANEGLGTKNIITIEGPKVDPYDTEYSWHQGADTKIP
tara:strand:- start:6599 stop:6871 length:273 start_codon:yes stop_codon:yes gene_type:complete